MAFGWLIGRAEDQVAVRRLLLAGIGLCYLCAFLSLWVQLHGLVGSQGILPNERFFTHVAERMELGPWQVPSLCWGSGCSDRVLTLLCALGTGAALLLIAGAAPLPAAVLAWLAYLSLYYAGQIFLSFQWDLLLLEAGFLAIGLAPLWALTPGGPGWRAPPSRIALLLLRWLLFRLLLSSGMIKLASGDPVWRDLTALAFHYESQPLPTWTSWYAYQLPLALQRLSAFATFLVELGAPLLMLGPRKARRIAAGATIALMAAIAATGNYGFFNLLTVVLCLSLLDDDALPSRLRSALVPTAAEKGAAWRARGWPAAVAVPVAAYLLLASAVPLAGTLGLDVQRLRPARWLLGLQGGLRLSNSYGLFATMTTSRPEILVEGTLDGESWRPYVFRWKPGDPKRAPRFAATHMPRLDWQMWFAALRGPGRSQWVGAFLARLLEGSPEVLGLLEADPFSRAVPLRVRATLYDYRFTDRVEGARTGNWWSRARLGRYLELSRGELR